MTLFFFSFSIDFLRNEREVRAVTSDGGDATIIGSFTCFVFGRNAHEISAEIPFHDRYR